MHDSVTTMLMRCKLAGINGIGVQTKRCIYTRTPTASCRPLAKMLHRLLTNILCQNFPLWPKRTYDITRQSHRTTRKGRGSLRLTPIISQYFNENKIYHFRPNGSQCGSGTHSL